MKADARREAGLARRDWADRLVARRGWCLGGWALAGLMLSPLAGDAERVLDASGRIPGSESAAVEEALATRFESPFARSALLVATGIPSPETDEGRAVLRAIVDGVRGAPGVLRTSSRLDGDPGFPGREAGTYVVVGLEDLPPERVLPGLRAARSRGGSASAGVPAFPGLRLLWTGEGALNLDLRRASTEEVRRAEARVLPLSLVLLLVAFGAVVAALLPVAERLAS